MKKLGAKTTKLPIFAWIGIGIIGITAIGGGIYNTLQPKDQILGEGINTINVLPEWKSILEGKAMNQRTITDVVLIGKTATASSTTILEVNGNSYFDGTASISGAINLGNLINCDTIDSDANGLLSCGSDASGAGAVVSHGLLDSESHTDVLLASASEGSIIIGNATPKWSELTIGASQSFFMSNGTTAGWYDYVDQNTTYTATDPLWINGTTIDIDIASAGGSGYLNVTDWQNWTDHVASTNAHLDWTADQGATNIHAGNYTDTNTTYTATEPLSLVGTAFDIDYASGTSDGYLLGRDYETLWGHQASANAHIDWTKASSSFYTTGNLDVDGVVSISNGFEGVGLADCDTALTSKLLWDVTTKKFSCGTDTDNNTTYTAKEPLSLVGTEFDIDLASTGGDGYLSKANWDTFNAKQATITDGTNLTFAGATLNVDDPFTVSTFTATNASVSSNLTATSGDLTSASFGTAWGAGLVDCDTAGTSKLLWSDTGVFSCGTDQTAAGTIAAHMLLSDTHNDTLEASVSQGSLLIGNATPAWSELTIGASNSFFISNGTTANWNDASNYLGLSHASISDDLEISNGRASISDEQLNTIIGGNSFQANTTGQVNTAIGYWLLSANTTGSENTVVGSTALIGNTTGHDNVAMGIDVLQVNTDGEYNVSLGNFSLSYNTVGGKNVVVGHQALYYETLASSNVAIGYQAGMGQDTYVGNYNTFIGYKSGSNVMTGADSNTLIGYQAGSGLLGGNSNIVLGSNVNPANVNGNQQLNIGNLIYGTGIYNGSGVSSVAVTGGMIGIGDSAPAYTLSVDGTASVSEGFFGSGLADCDTSATSKLLWDTTTGMFSCGTDQTAAGVIAPHNLLSDTHNDTTEASVSAGSLILGDADSWDELAIGASQSFLMSNGTTAGWYDYADLNTTYTAGDNLTLTLTDFDLDPFISITAASISEDLDVLDVNITSASIGTLNATTLAFPDDSIVEADISFSTACAAGNHYYLSGTNLACEADANTTYTATDPLFLTGTAFDIDYASAGGGGYILGTTWEDFNGKLSSLSIDTSAELISIIGDETGSNHIVFDTSPEFTTSFTTTGVFAINPGGALTIGDGGDTLYINSSDWDVSTTGDLTNIGAITMDGILTVASSTVGFGGNVDFYSTASTSSNFDFNSAGLLINIGNAGTDFTTGGGLNMAGTFDIEGAGLASGNWQFTTGTVEFDGLVSTSNNWTGYAGAWDLGALGSFELPNNSNPTVDAAGEIAIDSTDGQLTWFGLDQATLIATQSFGFAISSASFDATNPTGGRKFNDAITIVAINCVTKSATSIAMQIDECDANGANCVATDSATEISCSTTNAADDGALSNSAIDAGDWVMASMSQVSGEVDWLYITVEYKFTEI